MGVTPSSAFCGDPGTSEAFCDGDGGLFCGEYPEDHEGDGDGDGAHGGAAAAPFGSGEGTAEGAPAADGATVVAGGGRPPPRPVGPGGRASPYRREASITSACFPRSADPSHASLIVSAAGVSKRGHSSDAKSPKSRQPNQDALAMAYDDPAGGGTGAHLFVVCDGHGSEGHVASQLVRDAFEQELFADPDFREVRVATRSARFSRVPPC